MPNLSPPRRRPAVGSNHRRRLLFILSITQSDPCAAGGALSVAIDKGAVGTSGAPTPSVAPRANSFSCLRLECAGAGAAIASREQAVEGNPHLVGLVDLVGDPT